jgi:hypothetical protein
MKGVLIHHWDTDGLCSCAILRKELRNQGHDKGWTYFMPRIGNYFLTEKEMRWLEEAKLDELGVKYQLRARTTSSTSPIPRPPAGPRRS